MNLGIEFHILNANLVLKNIKFRYRNTINDFNFRYYRTYNELFIEKK